MKTARRKPRRRVRPETPDQVLARAAAYGIDLTLLEESLKRTPTERFLRNQAAAEFVQELRKAGERHRNAQAGSARPRSL